MEFIYKDGAVGGLTCNCYYTETCKHCAAALTELKNALKIMSEICSNEQAVDCIAGIDRDFLLDNIQLRDGNDIIL